MDATAPRAKRKTTAAPAVQSEVSIPPLAASFDVERKAAELQDRIDKLEATLTDVDSMANSAFDRIRTMVRLTLCYMRNTDALRDVTTIANALDEIAHAAEEAQNYQDMEVRDAGLTPDNDTRNLVYLKASGFFAEVV